MTAFRTFALALLAILSPLWFASGALAESHGMSDANAEVLQGGIWTNQAGSTASFTFSQTSQPATYSVTGVYINREAGYRCQNTPYPLTGIYYANTLTISFAVAWSDASQDCQSVTGWTGYFGDRLQLETNWNLAFRNGSTPSIASGKDVFTYSAANE